MLYSLSTTAREVLAPSSADQIVLFSSGSFSTAVTIYIRKVNTKNPWIILSSGGKTSEKMMIPHGTQLEAYTDAGTAELVVVKTCCS